MICKHCGSDSVVKKGFVTRLNGNRLKNYKCKSCGKRFDVSVDKIEVETKPKIKIEESVLVDKHLLKHKNEHGSLKDKYKHLLKENVLLEEKNSIFEEYKKFKPEFYNIKETELNDGTESTAIALLSDVHCEEHVDGRTVNYMNEYNLEICEHRMNNYFKHVLKVINIQRSGTTINKLILGLLGDFASGYIHEELQESNLLSPTQALLFIYEKLINGINFLLQKSDMEEIIVPCCLDNHMRTTDKIRISTAYKNSFAWLLYQFIDKYYINEPRVKIKISESYHNILEVYGRKIRFHHGHAMKFQGGVGGIVIPANKAISQWNKAETVYLDNFAHFHTLMDGGNFLSNGSLIGYNSYALQIKAGFEQPQQILYFINKKYGKTGVFPIFVK